MRRPPSTRRCSRASAATRTERPGSTSGTPSEIEELARHPRVAAVGETGLDYYRDRAPRDDQHRAFRAQIEIARRVSKPLVIHVRDGGQTTDGEALADTFELLRAEADGVTVVLHCFSAPAARALQAAEWGWYCSFAGNATYPRSDELREAAAAVPDELLLVETDSPFLAPQPVRGKPNQPANVVATAEVIAEVRGVDYGRARGDRRGERDPGVRMVRLGQNFLADSNLLEAIVREADLDPGDVVLEVGGGEGVLTERLAPEAAFVHVVELDERLREPLEARGRPGAETSGFISGTRCGSTSRALDPAPTAVVANLPYSIATPLLLRTIAELPAVGRWTVMVQREIADRLRAAPGSRAYGAPSVLVQFACEVRMLRPVDRAVFTPRPRVDSALLRLERTGPAASEPVVRLVRDAFAHRRKALARSLEHAGGGPPGGGTGGARRRSACPRTPARSSCRPRSSQRWRSALGVMSLLAPAKLNLGLFLGERREDGLHELRSLFCPLELADRISVSDAGGEADEVVCPGVEGPNLASVALDGAAGAGLGHGRRCGSRSTSGSRSPPGSEAGAPTPRRFCGWRRARSRGSPSSPRRSGRTSRRSSSPPSRSSRAPASWSSSCRAPDEFGLVLIPDDEGLETAATSTGRRTSSGSAATRTSSSGSRLRCARSPRRARRRSTIRRAARQRPRAGGDLAAARRSPRRSRRSRRRGRAARW